MNPLDLSVQGPLAWLQLLAGLALYLAPGIAAAQRFLPRSPLRWLMAPIFSVSLLTVSGIVLDVIFGAPVNAVVTGLIAVAWTAWFGRHWRQWGKAVRVPKKVWLPILFIVPFVAMVQALPHIPGEDGDALDAYPRLLGRAGDGLSGDDHPYPIHVDEYIRMSQMSDMAEEGTMVIGDPYTGEPAGGSLFSIQGLRAERGFALAMAQIHLLTGASLPVIARFLPALWAGYTGAVVYAALRPAPGAAVAGALTAVMPNSARFLGSGFLVPSNFGLPWIFLAFILVREAPRQRLLAVQWLVATAAFSMHIVIGTMTLAAMVLMHVFHDDRGSKLTGVLGTMFPLVWLLPPLWADAQVAVSDQHTIPFFEEIIRQPGTAFYLLAVIGIGVAFWQTRRGLAVHRALAIIAVATGASMAWSIATQHHNEATYARILFPFLLASCSLAGLAIGSGVRWLGKQTRSPVGVPVAVVATLFLAAPGVDGNLDMQIYRIHNDDSWARHAAFVALEPPEDAIYLAEPWQAPSATWGTQARPWTVLYPGAPPVNAGDYTFYLRSNGANATWLQERGIDYVLSPVAPNAPHDEQGPGVWRLTEVMS